MKEASVREIAGWLGVMCIVAAYMCGVFGVVSATSVTYLVSNAVGSAGIIWSSWGKKDAQPVVLNLIWIIVAVIGLIRAYA